MCSARRRSWPPNAQDQRPDTVDLCRFRLRRRTDGKALDPAEETVWHREMWEHAERVMATVLSEIEAQGHNRIKTAINPRRRRVLRAEVRICAARRHRPRLAVRPTQVDSICPKDPAHSTSMPTARRRCRLWCHGDLRLDGTLIGILIEHYCRHFPLWLAPVQAVVTTITSEATNRQGGRSRSAARGLARRIDLPTRRSTTRSASNSLAKIPALLVVGKKEAERVRVSIRRLAATDKR